MLLINVRDSTTNYSFIQSFANDFYNRIQECFEEEVKVVVSSFTPTVQPKVGLLRFQRLDFPDKDYKLEIHLTVNPPYFHNQNLLQKTLEAVVEDVLREIEQDIR